MIFFCLIPGQETINARTIEQEGAGFITRSLIEIRQKVLFLKDQAAAHGSCRAHALTLARPDASQRITTASGI
jgi:UDP-N-acetylglucosamine:LPS N-acetylglucosamine transferase